MGVLLDHQQCYDAMRSRDRRFDGRFWVGVRTTGIYCRPICPSRTPLQRNVDFYAHPAAAEDAGLRPCRRCQPDAAPGSAAWLPNATMVDRAVRLIEQGALDDGSVADLAKRLHVGDRHLRRLFVEHLGTTPDAVARSRRAHLARRLLIDTDLGVADIAFSAGFGSIRQCNDVVRTTFGTTPTQLRRTGRTKSLNRAVAAAPEGSQFSLRLPARTPFDPDSVLDWFGPRTLDDLESVRGTSYSRRVRVGSEVGTIWVTPDHDHVTLDIDLPAGSHLGQIVAGVRRLFDLDADPDAVNEALARDPALKPSVAERPGMRVAGIWSGFEAVVRAVIGQQVSVAGARTIVSRISGTFGTGVFPEPDELAEADLESVGVVGRRADTIRLIAQRLVQGELALDGSVGADDLMRELVSVPGVGPWTASYVALRMGEPDAFPAGDLHIMRVLGVDRERDASQRSEAWRPWRAYAAMHLWNQPKGEPKP